MACSLRGVGSAVFLSGALLSACAYDDPSVLRGGAPGADGVLPPAAARDDDELVDVVVPDPDATVEGAAETTGAALVPTAAPPIVLFVNGRGATLRSGRNDSKANTSSIVQGTTTFPASRYASDAARWARLVDAVRTHFEPYNVTVVDTEPTEGTWLEAVVTSGSPSLVGYGSSLGGIAPSRCGVVGSSVVFVFDARLRDEVHAAEMVSHELAHSLSLGHTQTQTDLMSYTNRSPLAFEDVAAACGPKPARTERCSCGGATQNNHQQLLRYVGPATPASPPAGQPPPGGGPTAPAAASVAILSPADGSTYTVGETVVIKADVKVDGLSSVALHWRIDQTTYAYPCPSSSCSVSGSRYSWSLKPGGGDRAFAVRATRTTGAAVVSATHVLRSAATEPPTAPPPPPTDGGAAPAPVASDASALCVSEINRYRAMVGAAPLARWDGAEACTENQCRNDAMSKTPHGSFGACNELAQNECPGWGGWSGDPKDVTRRCLALMWAEGPGGGHYENMKRAGYTKVACSYYQAANGQITAIQNFR